MRTTLFFGIVFLLHSVVSNAQWSLSLGYQTLNAHNWDYLGAAYSPFLDHGFSTGVQYEWGNDQRLLSVIPALHYSRASSHYSFPNHQTAQTQADLLQIRTELRVYPMQFLCDCPDLQDRVFVHGELGWNRMSFTHLDPDLHLTKVDDTWHMGLGGGLILKFTDWLHISPLFRFFLF
jgi:hypothetical protein